MVYFIVSWNCTKEKNKESDKYGKEENKRITKNKEQTSGRDTGTCIGQHEKV